MKSQQDKINWIIEQHNSIDQWYDKPEGLDYSFHLGMVHYMGEKYKHLIPDYMWEHIELALWGHDLLEDVDHLTDSDVEKNTSRVATFIIQALTKDSSKPKIEYYHQLANYDKLYNFAIFVKLADRLANVTYSLQSGSTMWKKYKKENEEFINGMNLYHGVTPYVDMVDELNELFNQEWKRKK